MKHPTIFLLAWTLASPVLWAGPTTPGPKTAGPYERQIDRQIELLQSESPETRAAAAAALGVMRAYRAEDALIRRLDDPAATVRREAALALARCGGRKSVGPLLAALDDEDWLTRQAAHVSLTNLTGMEFPLSALASPEQRAEEAAVWRKWWATTPVDRPPPDIMRLLGGTPRRESGRRRVTASTTYKGPPDVLSDGRLGPEYWQTKNVPFPQWCTLDLGRVEKTSRVVVHQYGPAFVMTDCEVATSLDGKRFDVIQRKKGPTPVTLVVDFPPRRVRYVRITSRGSKNPTYPMTLFEVQVNSNILAGRRVSPTVADRAAWRQERAVRALGALGIPGATRIIVDLLGAHPRTDPAYRPVVRAGIRAVGRLREKIGFSYLVGLLDDPMWARSAAEALGDFGDRRAVSALLAAYPRYAKQIDGRDPKDVPRDDKMGFPSEDRMLETPYWIVFSLCRLPLDDPADRAALRKIAPLVMANLPGDHDAMMLYRQEVGHRLTRYLLEQSGLRQQACEHAMERLGRPRRVPVPPGAPTWPEFPVYRMSSWLPAVCTEKEDVPRLVALLEHEDGWVRINAAKTLAWIGDERAIGPIARILARAKAEADYGYSGTFKDEEYNDPAPRWRQALVRALGLLGADEHTDLMIRILDDPRSVLEVRRAAADALADLGNEQAIAALRRAAVGHAFLSVRNVARDALRARGLRLAAAINKPPSLGSEPWGTSGKSSDTAGQSPAFALESTGKTSVRPDKPGDLATFDSLVFIKGSNNIPNTIGTVEQADRWRQTYVVTDSGPVYRPGRNLYLLRPPRPDGKATPLTRFRDGYVGEPEISWDGRRVIFTHRGRDDPWWHLWRINVDGSGLEQLTFGPYHDVGPAYLPDGRIVFSSSRLGIRDEYHGYPCTGLWVAAPDGTGMHPIATNIGRDNEPAVLYDGRIVFSRLEVFYSRNKTELTLHAARPDGTQDMVLYGPERREFWRSLDHGPRTPADGQEAPLTHRVLRMSQPQPMPDGRHVIVVTQGGLVLIGSRRDRETIITPDNKTRSYTTPMPLKDGRVLCASTLKTPDRKKVDLGLYVLDPATGKLDLVYNDPAAADFEPRPVYARRGGPVLAATIKPAAYSGRFLCSSVFNTREAEVAQRGRLVRLIEGVPIVGRHSTQTNPWPVWKNHGGTLARVLGTIPLAADGSFFVEAPADRLLHFQVLDSDGRVVGNQLTWIYPRPGETKSCVGCHEPLHTTTPAQTAGDYIALASRQPPVKFLPKGNEFNYRAKAWFKGRLPPEIEARTRTVRAVNLFGR